MCQNEVVADRKQRRPSVESISRIGMDTSKHIFQLHGVNVAEQLVLRKKLRRRDMVAFFERLAPTVIAIEACGASHHWARLLQSFGHEVKMIAPQLVKPGQKRCCRRRSALRGDEPAVNAVRTCEDCRAASGVDVGRLARSSDPQSNAARQCDPRLCGGVRSSRRQGDCSPGSAARSHPSRSEPTRLGSRAVRNPRQGVCAVAGANRGGRGQTYGVA